MNPSRLWSAVLWISMAFAAPSTATGETFFAEARILCPVRLRVPEPQGDRRPPLLIGLHGRGGTAEAMMQVWDALQDPRPIYAVPEAPYPLFAGGDRPAMGWSWDLISEDRTLWARADPMVVRYILDVVRETRAKHPTAGGTYLLGHSQGVAYAYQAAALDPDLIQGVIAFAGILPSEVLPDETLKAAAGKVKVFIAHGRQDQSLDPKESQRAKEILDKLGFKVVYKEFDGGHGIHRGVLQQAQAWIADCERH